ncbi:Putative signal peptide peptidase SppA [Rosistilla carotiformis]|uniref:Signal peptide peptidase SppA n=1 Tax=Rosistilla carotiformis TaxID=2528017 RepID=A0A518JW67_9BACT|nr:S49 family peptidase [Rosistilla carotiformis]QDV69780.1 Putative signal peptide peptidase SppA [Rosistilla carotiformis]
MSRFLILCSVLACTVGCGKHAIKTDSLIRLVPARVHVSADPIAMQPQVLRDRSPLKTMPVQSGTNRKIALIDVDGLLVNQNQAGIGSMGDNPLDIFREKLDQVEREGDISAVIIRINSYGGGVTASDIMRRELESFRERTGMPIVAVLMDIATGGGYLLATAADQIVAHPTSIVGGFGVILNLYNLEDAMAQFNVSGQTIRAGKFVDIGSPERFLEEDEEELLTEIAEQYNERFREVVLQSRQRIHRDADIFDGRIFTGKKAVELGVVDQVGYIDDAIAAARAYTGDPNSCVVMLHREQDKARTPYAMTPNEPTQLMALPQIPGLMRARLPTFMYIWQPDPGLAP